jgi:hypothetical protein
MGPIGLLEAAPVVQVETLIDQVRENCEICNARHAGTYSLCGLLLRLRNLYKWELGLPPWEEPDPAAALDWVAQKEQDWKRLANEEFRPLRLGRFSLDPLDAEAVNARLRGSGLIYGAGYGWGLKPSFFLGRLAGRRRVAQLTVHLVGPELARDLFSAPALLSGERVVARTESAAFFLWDRIHDVKKSGQPGLAFALKAYGLNPQRPSSAALREVFPRIVDEELKTYIRHEVGEMLADGFPRDVWRAIIARFPGERVELVTRALKDALADTGPQGMLAYIIRARKPGSLGFYIAFLDGVRRLLLPQVASAFEAFSASGDWRGLEAARRAAYEAARERALTLVAIFGQLEVRDEDWVRAEIQQRIIGPLGL